MPTIKDIAALAKVSSATVSHVINKTRYVSDEVIERVNQAMDELGYTPNYLARSLRQGKTNTIGLLMPDSSNPYFAELGLAIEKAAFKLNYNVILCNTESKQEKELLYIDVLSQKQVDGIIFVSTGNNLESIEYMISKKIVFVMIDRELSVYQEFDFPLVLTDQFAGGQMAAEHILSLGHKRIACVTGPSFLTPSSQREKGFRQALQDAGVPVIEELIVKGDFLPESGYRAIHGFMSCKEPPTAVFACNDLMAFGVIRGANEAGLSIPDDLSVVGYDNIHLAAYASPSLTTVSLPNDDIAESAMHLLIAAFKKELTENKICLQASLVSRESSGELIIKNN